MQVKTFDKKTVELDIKPSKNQNLVALPALIDTHVHFRTPGQNHKENWITGAKAAIAGGVTTVFDMPNNVPATIDTTSLENKKQIIDLQLAQANIPLRHYFYLGATSNNIEEIEKNKNGMMGIKMFMGSSTGNLLTDKKEDQEKVFQKAAELNLVLAIHAEDESKINKNKNAVPNPQLTDHSKIRDREVATKALNQAIELAKKYGTKTYICHVSTKDEVALIRKAKSEQINIFAEVCPHHLFLNDRAYSYLGAKAQMNPPLRTQTDQLALWQGIQDGTIDVISTDHAPHTIAEKLQPYPLSPSGVPGIETYLPLLLNAYHDGKISLAKIVEVTSSNAKKIFGLPENNDLVVVDLNLKKKIRNKSLQTKCRWSPFAGWTLQGWPVYTVLKNKIYKI